MEALSGMAERVLAISPGTGAPAMIFRVSEAVYEYVMEHPLAFHYNRKAMQAQFDAIQALLDNSVPDVAASAVSAVASRAATSRSIPVRGWVAIGLAATGAAVATVEGLRRRASRPTADRPADAAAGPTGTAAR